MWDKLEHVLFKLKQSQLDMDIWLREDDVRHASLNFDKILSVICNTHFSSALAVIPDGMEKAVITQISAVKHNICIFQHGFDHLNYSQTAEKSELVSQKINPHVFENIAAGRKIMMDAFGPSFIPVMVPPWNRIDKDVKEKLHEMRFVGISTFFPVNVGHPSRLTELNPQVDLINWSVNDQFAGEDYCLEQIISFVEKYINGEIIRQPLGIMSHHRTMGKGGFEFLEKLFIYLERWPNLKPLDIAPFFGNKH